MKLILIILLLISSSIDIYSKSKWELNYHDDKLGPIDIKLKDSLNLYVLCYHGESKLVMMKSTDQGKSWNEIWESMDAKSQFDNKIRIKFWDAFDFDITERGTIIIGAVEGSYLVKSINDCKSFDTIVLSHESSIFNVKMFNENIGIALGGEHFYKTNDGWKSFSVDTLYPQGNYYDINFINDSTFIACANVLIGENFPEDIKYGFIRFNINSFEFEFTNVGENSSSLGFLNLEILDNNTYFITGGKRNGIGNQKIDLIYKSTDNGDSWQIKLNREQVPKFGLQELAFKNNDVGIAVGQLGKILYTYDGGESWIYENELHDSMKLADNYVHHIGYAGEVAILTQHTGHFYRMEYDPYDISKVENEELNVTMKIEDFKIKFDGNIPYDSEIYIYNLEGELVLREKLVESNSIHKLSSGLYIVKLVDKGKCIFTNKFIKMN